MHVLLQTVDKDIVLVDSDPEDSEIDFEAPLMSLPHLFNTNLSTIPSSKSYLYANRGKVISWGNRLKKPTFKVGICWQGSTLQSAVGRSVSLSLFEDISKLPNVELISLHKGEGEKQIRDINFNLTTFGHDFDSGENAFIDTAALMVNCDLIISCDTSIAHLAGALGCQIWVALKKIPEWRWMLDRTDSPWYPNMTLYRQKEPDNWETVFKSIKQDLLSLIKNKQNNVIQSPPQEVMNQLVNLYNQGQFAIVAEQAKILTKQYPTALLVWNILGAANIGLGCLEKATEALKKVTELDPNYAIGFNNYGIALKDQGKLNEAVENFKKALLINPNSYETYNNMGNALQDQGKSDKAIRAHKKSISLNPDYAQAYYNMGIALKDKGRLEEAIEAFNKSIALKPDFHESYNNMGNALQDQGKLDEAIDAYNKALLIKPDRAEVYNNMGSTLKYQGKPEKAVLLFKKSISLKPDYAEAHQNLGFILLNNSHLKEGFEAMEWRWKTPKFFYSKGIFHNLRDGKHSLNDKRILFGVNRV